jgi:hypothetical protein
VSGRASPSCSPHASDNEISDSEEVDLSASNENDEGERRVDDNGLIAELRVALSEYFCSVVIVNWVIDTRRIKY